MTLSVNKILVCSFSGWSPGWTPFQWTVPTYWRQLGCRAGLVSPTPPKATRQRTLWPPSSPPWTAASWTSFTRSTSLTSFSSTTRWMVIATLFQAQTTETYLSLKCVCDLKKSLQASKMHKIWSENMTHQLTQWLTWVTAELKPWQIYLLGCFAFSNVCVLQ